MARPCFHALFVLLVAVAAGCATGGNDELPGFVVDGSKPDDAALLEVGAGETLDDASTPDAPLAEVEGDASPLDATDAVTVEGGAPDAAAETTPIGGGGAGKATVAGGVKAESGKYLLITTTGQSPGGNALLQSGKYELRGGVVGVTQ